jgi:hypothetical protein
MNINPIDLTAFLQNFNLTLPFKIVLLVFITLYAIFAFMLFSKIRALDKIIFFPSSVHEFYLKEFAFFHLLAVVSLFFITLVIV